jgi:phage gpG-like protein
VIDFDVEVIGEEEVNAALAAMERQFRDFRPVWPRVSAVFDEMERKLFESGGATGASGPWVPLSEPYSEWKAVHYPGEPILHLSGNLMRSLTGVFNPDAINDMEAETLTRGSTVPYARVHQRSKIRRRPVIDPTEADKQAMLSAFRDGLGDTAILLGFEVL